ncbi:MAG: HEAT repeat domain-containing protein [Clostridia bacterium]|nr:HEAT repeat domain-containing protein [Clostridia bacterium]
MLFGPKDIFQKITVYGEKGKLRKLERLASKHEDPRVRAAAYRAMGRIPHDLRNSGRVPLGQTIVEILLDVFNTDEPKKVKLACAQALEKTATRSEFDAINHLVDDAEDEELKKTLQAAAIAAKDRISFEDRRKMLR